MENKTINSTTNTSKNEATTINIARTQANSTYKMESGGYNEPLDKPVTCPCCGTKINND
jgi:hypothetical protein